LGGVSPQRPELPTGGFAAGFKGKLLRMYFCNIIPMAAKAKKSAVRRQTGDNMSDISIRTVVASVILFALAAPLPAQQPSPENPAFDSNYQTGMNMHLASKFKAAEKGYLKALEASEGKEGFPARYWRTATLLAVAYQIHGYPQYAERFYNSSAHFWLQYDQAYLGMVYGGLARIELQRKKYSRAAKFAKDALRYEAIEEARTKAAERYGSADLLSLQARICEAQGQASCAEQNYKKALALFAGKSTAFPFQVLSAELMDSYPIILYRAGAFYHQKGDDEKARALYAMALTAWGNWTGLESRPALEARVLEYKGRTLLALGRKSEGVSSLNSALSRYSGFCPAADPRITGIKALLSAAGAGKSAR
jgi:tetratricopeptide (TPR) repeat protein